jgi:selenocysteine lyase/cysteine desulfurase
LRVTEYSYLDENGQIYLDYAGAGLAARAQLEAHADRVWSGCYGNPNSEYPTSSASARLVERTREAVLRFFNTTRDDYAVIFTPNATGACRLVGESYLFRRHGRFVLTADNHNSVNGMGEFARARGARVAYVPIAAPDLRTGESDVLAALSGGHGARRGLFAYPAQSNFTGVQHPLTWVARAQEAGYDVLLDAAAYVPANQLDLGAVRPEFIAVSWYKVFGYPTGVGCLLVRRDALPRLRRPWFPGGTSGGAGVQGGRDRLLGDEAAFEDGTLNFLSIPDVATGLAWVSGIGLDVIHQRVCDLTGWLLQSLGRLKHSNGAPVIQIYGPVTGLMRGGTVALNFLDPDGRLVDERVVARDAAAAGIALRTGCFCNPGTGQWALGTGRADTRVRRRLGRGFSRGAGGRDFGDYLERAGLPAGGAVRISFGIASTSGDAEAFLDFAERTYRDRWSDLERLPPRLPR